MEDLDLSKLTRIDLKPSMHKLKKSLTKLNFLMNETRKAKDSFIDAVKKSDDTKIYCKFDDNFQEQSSNNAVKSSDEIKGDLNVFKVKYNMYSSKSTIQNILTLQRREVMCSIDNFVNCIGCRKSLEAEFSRLSKILTNERFCPFVLSDKNNYVSLADNIVEDCNILFKLLHSRDHKPMPQFADQPVYAKYKKVYKRCALHSLEIKKNQPITVDQWTQMWNFLTPNLKERAMIIDFDNLSSYLMNYCDAHSECTYCRLNIFQVYRLLKHLSNDEVQKEEKLVNDIFKEYRVSEDNKTFKLPDDRRSIIRMFTLCDLKVNGRITNEHSNDILSANQQLIGLFSEFMVNRFSQLYYLIQADIQSCIMMNHIIIQCFKKNFYSNSLLQGNEDLDKICAEIEKQNDLSGKQKRKQRWREKKKNEKHELNTSSEQTYNEPPAIVEYTSMIGSANIEIPVDSDKKSTDQSKKQVNINSVTDDDKGKTAEQAGSMFAPHMKGDDNNGSSDKESPYPFSSIEIEKHEKQVHAFEEKIKRFMNRKRLQIYCKYGLYSQTTKINYTNVHRNIFFDRHECKSYDSLNDDDSFIAELEYDTKVDDTDDSSIIEYQEFIDDSDSNGDSKISRYANLEGVEFIDMKNQLGEIECTDIEDQSENK